MLQWEIAKPHGNVLAIVGRRLAGWSLLAFLIGGAVGLINGWWWWRASPERLEAALARLASKVHFGLWELGFYLVLMVAYLAWWKWAPPRSLLARLFHALLAIMAATNLLWHFPPLMTILAHVAANEPYGEPISSGEFRALMFSAFILPRCFHYWLASLAVGGLTLAVLAARAIPAHRSAADDLQRWAARGARLALVCTMLQMLVGAWVLMSSPQTEQSRLMGDSVPATLLLVGSIAAALWLMHLLASIALGQVETKPIMMACGLMTVVIFAMSATLILARGETNHAPQETQRSRHSSPNRI